MPVITLLSPAKINLFLKVHGKRDDGYHEITTLMQAVNLFDEIQITPSEKDSVTTDHSSVPDGHENLAYKALFLIKEELQLNNSFKIEIKKKIPPQAGLGGGSSNAATVLFGINQMQNMPLSIDQLKNLGAELGSDVPFFFSLGTALCTGRGEKIINKEQVSLPQISLALPKIEVCTKQVYSAFLKTNSDLQDFSDVNYSDFFNDLEHPAFKVAKELVTVKRHLEMSGCKKVLMSGSGSSFICFGESSPSIDNAFPIKKCCPIQRKDGEWYV